MVFVKRQLKKLTKIGRLVVTELLDGLNWKFMPIFFPLKKNLLRIPVFFFHSENVENRKNYTSL